jgi:hypothetical protein
VRQERGRPLIFELEAWLRQQRAKLSRNNNTTKAINYCPSRWDVFAASSAMGACACRTMPPNASYWPSPYEEETKSLQAQMRARGRSMPSPLLPCRSNLAGLGIHAALERPILRVATNLSKLIETLGACPSRFDVGVSDDWRGAHAALASLTRLWAVQMSAHSALTFSMPRNRNCLNPLACLICPNTGSTICFRNR